MRHLDPDVFDTLELADIAFGGIGAGVDTEYIIDHLGQCSAPWCAHGCVLNDEAIYHETVGNDALIAVGISRTVNDDAVFAIRARLGLELIGTRVPFAEWVKELEVMRG